MMDNLPIQNFGKLLRSTRYRKLDSM